MIPYFSLFTAPASSYHKLPAMAPEELYSPMERQYVEVDGMRIAYTDSGGDKPPLVFIHGLSSYTGFWEYQLQPFTESHRVLALDLPGYGASDRPDAPCTPPWYADVVLHWMDVLDLPRASLVGHSMGGQIAITLALDHPERVDLLALSAPAGIETFDGGAARWMKNYWHEGRAMQPSEREVRQSFLGAVFNQNDEGVERLIEERVRLGKHPAFEGTSVAVSRSIAGMFDHPVADRLGELSVPTLLVFGTRDKLIPNAIFNGGTTRSVAHRGEKAIVGSKLVLLNGAGHTVHHDAPEAFNAALSGFLAENRR